MASRTTSIKNRVRAVILAVSVMVMLATAAAFVAYAIFRFKSNLVRHLTSMAAVIADNSAASLSFDLKPGAETVLKALKVEPDIVAAVIYDLDGRVFAKYPPTLTADLLPQQLEGQGSHFQDGAVVVFGPVILEKKKIGTLYIRSSLEGLHQQFWRYGMIISIVLIGSVGIAFVLSTLLQKRITDPILALTSAAQAVSGRNDYSVRAPKVTDDELGTLTDAFNRMLTETEEQQAGLRTSEERLRLAHEVARIGTFEWNLQTGENRFSRELEAMYGLAPGAFPGTQSGWEELIHPDDRPEVTRRVRAASETGSFEAEWRVVWPDGSLHWLTGRARLYRDAASKPLKLLGVNLDITSQKMFEAKLEMLVAERTARLQETVGELEAFSYSVSHDMRAPLRAMQGYSQVLLDDYKDKLDAEAGGYLTRISRAANRLDLLIRDVLAYSRVAKAEIALHPVDLDALIEDILANHPELQPPRAHVVVKRPLHKLLGHEAYLTQCITNLLGNAVKFVAPGVTPEIHIRSEPLPGNKVRVWFEDNGIGIDPSHQERIFQIFGQVYPEKQYGGTGIGLAIVRKAVQRMGGDVGLESQLDKGSRFWLILNAV